MTHACSILLVDDEVQLSHTLSIILKKAGYQATTAVSAAEAMQILQCGGFDLIFLDLQLPDKDGISLLQEIRPLYPETPVLILTGHATLTSAIEAVRQGARDYLLKPVDPPYLLKRVAELLEDDHHPRHRRQIVSQIQSLLSELDPIELQRVNAENNAATSAPASSGRYLQRGPFVLDLHTRHVQVQDRDILLPPTIFDYLVTLVRHSPDPVDYETLVIESQGYRVSRIEAQEMVRWQIHELRKALENDPKHPCWIITVHNVGYRLVL